MAAKATEAHKDEEAKALVEVLERVLEALENPVEWTYCGACGCLLASTDEGGCPSCRYWLTSALEDEDEDEDESWE
jgi:lipopolysaccharide biosynthesis regulator YciM